MKLGIVGLPNVGKSTLFNAITNAGAESANYPFCTIDPNVGVVAVPDKRLDTLSEMYHPKKTTPAVVEFVDIAGLVKGASQGQGLGNKFLANIRECAAIVHVVRCFDDENIMHVVADTSTNVPVDPVGDIGVIDIELIMADVEMVERRIDKAQKAAKGDKKFLREVEVFSALKNWLNDGNSARSYLSQVDEEDAALIATSELLSLKPVIYAANLDEDGFAGYRDNAYYKQVADLAAKEGAQVIPVCAKLEAEIAQLEPEEKQMFLDELGIPESRPGPAHPGQLRPAGPHLLPHRRGGRVPGLDHRQGHPRPPGRRQDPHRLRAGLHPGGGGELRRSDGLRLHGRRPGEGPGALRGQGVRHEGRGHRPVPLQRVRWTTALVSPGRSCWISGAPAGRSPGGRTRSGIPTPGSGWRAAAPPPRR